MVVTYNDKLTVFYNANGLQSEDQFCKATPFQLDLDNPKTVSMPAGTTIIPQSIKFGDMNIDSFPEVLLLLENGQQVIPFVLRNTNNV